MKTALAVLMLAALVGCKTVPVQPFEPGKVVEPPVGCKQGQERGVEC